MGTLETIFSAIILAGSITFFFISLMQKRKLDYRERKDALEREQAAANPVGTAKTIQKLEERVRVLERLATDGEQGLAAQIDALKGPEDGAHTSLKSGHERDLQLPQTQDQRVAQSRDQSLNHRRDHKQEEHI